MATPLIRLLALCLTTLTGFSGLVYEVVWQKYVATLLGSHSEASAAVLGLFLGGLSAGYALFGRVTRAELAHAARTGRPARLLLLYGGVETGIGVHALLFPLLFRGVLAVSLAIPHSAGGLGFALDVGLVALLVLPPTILMGGTIPILTQALARNLDDATRFHALVYGSNTAGAFLGALASDFALIPWLGLEHAVWAMGAVNLLAGASFAALGRRRGGALAPATLVETTTPPLGIYGAVVLLVGFAAMTLETVLIRLGGLALGSSQFTFSMVVAVFVCCIALGSFAVSALPGVPRALVVATPVALAALLALLYPQLPDVTYWAYVLRTLFSRQDAAFYPYYWMAFTAALTVLAIPVGLSGAMLPLVFDRVKREYGALGSAAGRLYAWNTVGSLLGALLGGYVLLFWLDLDQVYLVALGAVWLAAMLLALRTYALRPVLVALLLLAPLAPCYWLLHRWEPQRLAAGLFRTRQAGPGTYEGPSQYFAARAAERSQRIPFYDDDPRASVAVSITSVDGNLDPALLNNGKSDGSIRGDYPTVGLMALLPALFADRAERAFVIGFGTGVTVGELGHLDSMQKVVVAEISPGVIAASSEFEPYNLGAMGNPKTEVLLSDAYRGLVRSNDRFDVISSEPSNPWVTGVEMLYSREFLQAARDRLRPGGVYAQWFHLYEIDSDVVELVLRTYASVFDHVAVWYALPPDLILLGFQSDAHALDVERFTDRAARPDFAAGLSRSGIESVPALLAHEVLPLGVVGAAELRGDLHTLFHPLLNHRAARAFFRGGTGALPTLAGAAPPAGGAAK